MPTQADLGDMLWVKKSHMVSGICATLLRKHPPPSSFFLSQPPSLLNKNKTKKKKKKLLELPCDMFSASWYKTDRPWEVGERGLA